MLDLRVSHNREILRMTLFNVLDILLILILLFGFAVRDSGSVVYPC